MVPMTTSKDLQLIGHLEQKTRNAKPSLRVCPFQPALLHLQRGFVWTGQATPGDVSAIGVNLEAGRVTNECESETGSGENVGSRSGWEVPVGAEDLGGVF